jgi:hypothetical protein
MYSRRLVVHFFCNTLLEKNNKPSFPKNKRPVDVIAQLINAHIFQDYDKETRAERDVELLSAKYVKVS